MFGFVIASATSLSEEEKERYQAAYCGLCRTLARRYGQTSRTALTYDLTFFILLCNSLHEPAEETERAHCITHPVKTVPFAHSRFSDYAADLSVALAYHKCLDDVHDEGGIAASAGEKLLSGAYEKARARIPSECAAIESAMEEIRAIEASAKAPDGSPAGDPDAPARAFGNLLGNLFAHEQGFWNDSMRTFGYHLGRFIYLMDAAVDAAEDEKSGSYNPFVLLKSTPEDMRDMLCLIADDAARAFERLPLVQDVHLLRSVLYEGVWIQFNKTYEKQEKTTSGSSAQYSSSKFAWAQASASSAENLPAR